MDWTLNRTERDDEDDYPHRADPLLVVGICLVGRLVEELTGDDLCNWETAAGYTTGTFALRGSGDDTGLPNFSYGPAGSPTAFDVAWYKETGRSTTVSRPLDRDETVAAIAASVASLPGPVPDTVEDLWVYGHDVDPAVVAELLTAARHTGG